MKSAGLFRCPVVSSVLYVGLVRWIQFVHALHLDPCSGTRCAYTCAVPCSAVLCYGNRCLELSVRISRLKPSFSCPSLILGVDVFFRVCPRVLWLTFLLTVLQVAIKLESTKTKHPQLLYESKIYRILHGGCELFYFVFAIVSSSHYGVVKGSRQRVCGWWNTT